MRDDDFEPRLGRIRAAGSPRGRRYLHQVLGAVALAGGVRTGRRGRYTGARIGRGAAAACLLGSRRSGAALRGRRAVVKTRLVRLGSKGLAAARAHLRYIQRDGVTRDGMPGALYSKDSEHADGAAFLERGKEDRHQFRFIVSAEDGAQYSDLKPLIRRWMRQMEADLGTRLDWIAADHLDTSHPHTHVMLRGKDDRGDNLVIARAYIASGMRERLAELVALDLGPRTDLEVARTQRREVAAERLTSIDRALIRDANGQGIVAAGHLHPLSHALRSGRLRKLAALGLAEPLGAGRWRLPANLDQRLRELGERGDIVRTMQRALGRRAALAEIVVGRAAGVGTPLVGRVARRGLADELHDRHYLIVEAIDGRAHYVDVGPGETTEPIAAGSVVRVLPAHTDVRAADRTIAAVAAAHAGIYSPDRHRAHDPSASTAFVEAHVRRLEAVRRGSGGIERAADASWRVGDDYLARAAAYEAGRAKRVPVRVEVLSAVPFAGLAVAEGATWLDRELVADAALPLRDAGFGREVRKALESRRRWLLAKGLAWEERGATFYPGDLLPRLRRQEILRVAQGLADELGLAFAPRESGNLEGRLARRIDLASGRFAVVTRARDFSLVPWREGMEHRLGRELTFSARGGQVSWRLARGRPGPEIG